MLVPGKLYKVGLPICGINRKKEFYFFVEGIGLRKIPEGTIIMFLGSRGIISDVLCCNQVGFILTDYIRQQTGE